MLIYGKPLDGVASIQATTCQYLKGGHLRANVYNFRESVDSCEFLNIFIYKITKIVRAL